MGAQAQRAELEQRAAVLNLEFQQKKTADEFSAHRANIEKANHEQQAKIQMELHKVTGQAQLQTQPMVQPAYAAPPGQTLSFVPAAHPPVAYAAHPQQMSYVPPGAVGAGIRLM